MRTRACLAGLLLVASSFVTLVPKAGADEKDAVTEVARRRFQEGVKYYDQKKYEEARAAFLQAYALKRHPAVLINLAQSESRSGHPLEAARHFSAFLRESPNVSPAERLDAEKGLAAARTKLGRIHVAVPSGADVTVDGEAMGQGPFAEPIDVLPGTHTVEARLSGRVASATVSVQVGKAASANLVLESAPTAAAPAPIPAPVAPPPVATTPAPPPMPPPAPEPELKPPGPEPAKEPEPAAQVSTEGSEPFFSWLGHNGVGIAGLGVMVVGIGVGTGFALAASKASENSDAVASQILTESTRIGTDSMGICVNPKAKVDGAQLSEADKPGEVQKFTQACSLLSDDLDKHKQDRAIATGGFALAGVGLAATLTAYLLTSSRSSTSAKALVVPVFAPSQRGLALIGTF
jgi:hypothetical protein